MAAIDQAAAEPPLPLRKLVEVNPRGILVEPRRKLMLGFFDRHPVDMVDPLARLVIAPAVG